MYDICGSLCLLLIQTFHFAGSKPNYSNICGNILNLTLISTITVLYTIPFRAPNVTNQGHLPLILTASK